MKKVSIATFCNNMINVNYGQVLQCYAIQEACKKLNCKVEVIRYRHKKNEEKLKNGFNIGIIDKIYESFYQKKYAKNSSVNKIKKFQKFMSKNVNLTNPCYDISSVTKITKKSDILLCGSDQIWNPAWIDDVYQLNFGSAVQKRIAYAGSGIISENKFAINKYNYLGNCLNKFDAISLREQSGIDILQKYTKNTITDVLDPVFLLSTDEWDKLTKNNFVNEPYIFCYTLNGVRPYKMLLRRLMQMYNVKKVICVEAHCVPNNSLGEFEVNANAGPEDFLTLIKNATLVCTDSFHGIAMSINYKKQFCAFSNKSMWNFYCSDRKKDLLNKLHITNRLCNSLKDVENLVYIDYNEVEKYLNKEREKSWNFLKNAIDSK